LLFNQTCDRLIGGIKALNRTRKSHNFEYKIEIVERPSLNLPTLSKEFMDYLFDRINIYRCKMIQIIVKHYTVV
jgi:hypothetical protein